MFLKRRRELSLIDTCETEAGRLGGEWGDVKGLYFLYIIVSKQGQKKICISAYFLQLGVTATNATQNQLGRLTSTVYPCCCFIDLSMSKLLACYTHKS